MNGYGKRIGLIIMLAFLISTSGHWLNPSHICKSNYSAPWIYPGLLPENQ